MIEEFPKSWPQKTFLYFCYWVGYILLLGLIQANHHTESFINELISSPPKIVFVLIIVELLMDRLLFKGKTGLFICIYIPLLIGFSVLQRLIDNYIIIDHILLHWKKLPLLHQPTLLYNVIKLQFAITVPFTFKLFSYWSEAKNRVQIIESEKMQAELLFLRNQFQPHFIFNILNSLYSKIINKSDEAADIVIKISSLLRFTVYDFNIPLIPLSKEINYLKDYIALQKIRFDSRLELSFVIDGDIEKKMINPFLLIPFIENSFKHCANDEGLAWITIYLSVKNDWLSLQIENSKSLTKPLNDTISVESIDSGGIGLDNVKRRLALLYPENHVLKIQDQEESFFVLLKIKLENTNDIHSRS